MTARRTVALTLGALFLLVGCTSDPADNGKFQSSGTAAVSCQQHQTQKPGTDYTGGAKAKTASVLAVLRYYVTNGAKPYCDGKPPTADDRAWATLVVDLGGDPASVQSILGSG